MLRWILYHELELGQGCWVTEFPKDCGQRPEKTGQICHTGVVTWVFGGLATVFSLIVLVISNAVLIAFVHNNFRPRRKGKRRWSQFSQDTITRGTLIDGSDDDRGLVPPIGQLEEGVQGDTTPTSMEIYHQDLLKLFRSQALLLVGAAILCSLWSGLLRIFETHHGKTAIDETELFPLLLLQAWFLPLQGFLNLFIWARPKFHEYRRKLPKHSKLLCFQLALVDNSKGKRHYAVDQYKSSN